MNPVEKLALLRAEMKKRHLDAYVVVTDDFHASEYVGAHFKAREFLSGFTGSAGTLVVLPDAAALWTDGRYFLQASQQLEGSGIELMRMGQPGDLVLVFADALTRSWKQIIRFKPDGDMPKAAPRAEVPALETTLDEQLVAAMEGVVRDERGLRFEREESD